jgi:ribonuclease P protein component
METLRKSRDFRRAVDGGSREILATITAYRLPNHSETTRVGISVTRRAGNSVARNRIKRRIREAIRLNASFLPTREDIVIVARPDIGRAAFDDIERDIRRINKGKIREDKDK